MDTQDTKREAARKRHKRGGIYKRGATWWIQWCDLGKVYRESCGVGASYDDAKRLRQDRLGKVAQGAAVTPRMGRLTVDEALADVVNDYKTNGKRSLRNLEGRIAGHVRPFFGGRRLATVTTPDIRRYIAARQTEGAAPASINRELAIIKRAFTLAVRAGLLVARPYVPMLQEDNTRIGFFEADQYAAVCRHLPAPIAAVVRFAYATGWRTHSEALGLTWRQVDFKAGTIRLEVGVAKNREGRTFPMTMDLRALLEAQRAVTDTVQREHGRVIPWVFHRTGDRIRDFRKVWASACKAAGCPGRIPHDFRRTAVRNLERAGVSRSVAMKLTGHKTEAIYRRYAIVAEADLHEAARKLDQAATR